MSMKESQVYSKCAMITESIVSDACKETNEMFRWNKDGEYVLDVGCGPGDITSTTLRDFLPENSKIVGGDISPEMIQFGNNKYASNNIQFKLMDICDKNLFTEWKRQEFSHIFSFNCLHRVQDFRLAYENIDKLLKPGGFLLCTFIVDNNWSVSHKYLAKKEKYCNYSENLINIIRKNNQLGTISEQILRDMGYTVLYTAHKKRSYCFNTFNLAFDYLKSVSLLSSVLPEHLVEEAMEDVKNNNIAIGMILEKDAGFEYRNRSFTMLASKPEDAHPWKSSDGH